MLSVGEILKKERERLGLTLSQIEKKIKIRQKFLILVEENDWSHFSSKVYIEGVITNYSKILNLDPEKTLAFFRRDYERNESLKFKRKIASAYLTPETKKIAILSLIFVFLIFFSYFGYQLINFLSPPKLTIISPNAEIINNKDRIKIIGKTEKDAAVSIFGERVYQNKEGIFEYSFPLKEGKNELLIEVIGANGKKTILKRIYVKKK